MQEWMGVLQFEEHNSPSAFAVVHLSVVKEISNLKENTQDPL
jgi:hypothetical protein